MTDTLHEALLDLVGLLNSPQYDDILLREAGLALDRALFPLLVRIGLRGPLGVAELAAQVGRDHSTVSRQVAKLEAQGLVARGAGAGDRRIRAAIITAAGRRTVDVIARARERLMERLLTGWSAEDRRRIAELNRRLADAMRATRRCRLARLRWGRPSIGPPLLRSGSSMRGEEAGCRDDEFWPAVSPA